MIEKLCGDFFINLGIGVLLAGIGVGLALSWAFEDPVIEGCSDAVDDIFPSADRSKALKDCIEARSGKKDED